MDGFNNQPTRVEFNAVTLTAAYTDNRKEIDCGGMTKIALDIDYAMGAAETANVMSFTLEHSPDDGVTWYSLVIDSTGTTSEITPRVWELTGTNKVNIIVDIAYKKMRLSMSEAFTTNAGTVSVTSTLSGI